MDIHEITAETTRQALHAIRYGHPLRQNRLLEMDALTLRLRDEGAAASPQRREWSLAEVLADVVWRELTRLRGARSVGRGTLTPEQEMALLEADFKVSSPDLEAWSALQARYLSTTDVPVEVLADQVGISYRTFARRLDRGSEALAACLRAEELEAERELRQFPGAPVAERIVVERQEPGTEPQDPMAALLDAIRDDARVVRLTPEQIDQIARHGAGTNDEYRLGRIAEWSRPRYRLDERFVALSLLVDQGESSPADRWVAGDRRFGSLREVVTDLPDPAFVLLGPPGSGKSTLLRRLELDLAVMALRGELDVLTFYVPLSLYQSPRLGEPPPPPDEWLAEQWSSRFPNMPDLPAVLAEGRMVLLLDGLNEMPHAGQADYRERILLWKLFLQQAVGGNAGNRVVFSCRSLDYSAPLSTPALRVPQARCEPLTDEQVRRFLELHDPAHAERIWQELEGSQQLELLRAPYFLELLVEQVAAEGEVPRGRAELFTGFVRHSLRREIERDNPLFLPDGLIAERDYQRVVQARRWRSAYELPERGVLFVKLDDLARCMQESQAGGEAAQIRIDYDRALDLLDDARAPDVVRAGVALSVLDEDRDRDEVLFFHQLVQEYFAARSLARRPDPALVTAEWRAGRVEPSLAGTIGTLSAADPLPGLPTTGWEETTVLAAPMSTHPDAFVGDVSQVNLPLAGRCAASPELAARLAPETVGQLRSALVGRSRDPGADLRARIAAASSLGGLGDPRFERYEGPDGPCLVPPMVPLEGGSYVMGTDAPFDYLGQTIDSHRPMHRVELKRFSIGRFPVTNAEWALFMTSGGYEDDRWWTTPAGRAWRRGEGTAAGTHANQHYWRGQFRSTPGLLERVRDEGRISAERFEGWKERMALDDEAFEANLRVEFPDERYTEPRYWSDEQFSGPLQPVVGITWYEAQAYCRWLAEQAGRPYRLPTEAEWEAAARGHAGRTYAHGDGFDASKGNTLETHVRRPTPIGVFPEGDTPEGVADLTGNVTDWTVTLWGEDDDRPEFGYPYDPTDGREDPGAPPAVRRILRGSSWNAYEVFARAAFRFNDHPGNASYNGGCRVAMSW